MTVLAPVTRMPDVAKLIEQFPELTIVIDHMADSPLNQPEELEKLLALQRYPKVFVKISHSWSLSSEAYPYLDSQAADQAPVRRLRPQAPDRRNRLAAR